MHDAMRRLPVLLLVAAAWPVQAASLLPSLTEPASWTAALLPKQTLPRTRFTAVDLDGVRALRIEAQGSYGNLLHELPADARSARQLSWRWRVERFAEGTDLRRKTGDDTAAKVCLLFDMPLDRVPFLERQTLRMARAAAGDGLPAATLCYVWDATLPARTVLPNAYTRRLRWIVLQGAGGALARWQGERRDVTADFIAAFGDETREVPPLRAVLVGADADNTGGSSLAHVADLELLP
jgi:hypothetical protein